MTASQSGTGSLPASASRSRPAFTLVEMTIVIGIVVLLAGLTLAVSVSVVGGSEMRQTKLTIQLLDTAVQEWELQADRQVSYGINGEPPQLPGLPPPVYEIQQDATNDIEATAHLFVILGRNTGVQDIFKLVDPEFVRPPDEDDNVGPHPDFPNAQLLSFRDAWGNPIVAVFSGRVWDSNFDAPQDRDADNTIRTGTETQCGIASNRQICFVSFGPDGKPGNLDPLNYDPDAAQDNLYSYTPIRP